MMPVRQEPTTAEPFVARFKAPKGGSHFVFAPFGFSIWLATRAPAGPVRVLAVAVVAGLALAAVLWFRKRLGKARLAIDDAGVGWPAGDLFVPWADVVSVALVDRGITGVALRIEVRDGSGLVARQSPEASIPGPLRRRLAETGVLECGVATLDRPPDEVFEAAAARFRAASHQELEATDAGAQHRELRRPGSAAPVFAA
jgi:hypothetical protein